MIPFQPGNLVLIVHHDPRCDCTPGACIIIDQWVEPSPYEGDNSDPFVTYTLLYGDREIEAHVLNNKPPYRCVLEGDYSSQWTMELIDG